jgi:DNA uptake protein ComE-like DNA-binding protein
VLSVAVLVTSACGGDTAGTATPVPAVRASTATAQLTTTVPAATTTVAATAKAPTPAATTAPVVRKVNANTASRAEIQAALEAAGVPSAANWAREVTEYRPYAASDTNWTKLRGELAKYNPAPGIVDQIIAVLEK